MRGHVKNRYSLLPSIFMADPVTPPAPSTPPEAAPAPAATPAVPPAKEPDPVPYGRFKEVNDKAAAQAEELATFKAAEAERKKQAEIAAGNHQKVIDELTPKAARAAELESALQSVVDAEIATIPKERQSLVPDLPLEKKLAWITANRAILMGDKVKNVNHPTNPASGTPSGEDNQTFTQAQIKDSAFYEKNKDAIKKALREGRIVD